MFVQKVICVVFIQTLLVSTMAYGKVEYLKNGSQSIRVDYSYKLTDSEQRQTRQWLKTITDSLLSVYGEWPKDEFEIDVKKTNQGKGAVPWGQVNRGEPDKVSLIINPKYGFDAMARDWTAYHELSHLLIPYRGYGDLWISEGLASYYQNIIQARSGKFTENKFWTKLLEGFERGRKQDNWSSIKLSKLSSNMRRYRNYMRVHWSGVLFWLTADVKLRELSHNQKSLDTALKLLKGCCEKRSMSALKIMQMLDQTSEVKIFTPLYYEFRNSYAMPDYLPLIKEMGVEKKSFKKDFSFNPKAPYSEFRKAIFIGGIQ